MILARPAALALLLLLGGGEGPGFAPQIVKLKSGGEIDGRVVSEDGATEVVVNTFNSRSRAMTLGVERIAADKVKTIERAKNPLAEYAERARAAKKDDAGAHLDLAKLLKDAGFKALAAEEAVRAAVADPEGTAAAKLVGDAEWKRLSKSDPRLDPALRTALDAYFAEASQPARKKLHESLVREFAYPRSFLYLERALRSNQQRVAGESATGRQDDRPLTLRSKETKGLYTLYVPTRYDPLVPHPLVLALHGGGRGGKDGKDVVGSGPAALNFYQVQAEKRGVIVACPTAVTAPWNTPANEPLVRTVLEEVQLLFNVDENRVYLTGHSMGGFGTWHFGPKWAHLFAVIAPMSGGASNGFQRLRETGTGVYVYHGADDTVVGVGDERRAAETMKKDKMDFVYTELPNSGHGCPQEIIEESFDYFEAHRLKAAADRGEKGPFVQTKEPLSSFDRRVSKDERDYLGDPLKEEAGQESVTALLADLKKGGGSAEAAGLKLGELKDPKSLAPLGAIVTDPREARDVRCAAARALGAIQKPEALAPLVKALRENDVLLTIACADALGALGEKKAVAPLREALKVSREFLKSKLTGEKSIEFTDWAKVHDHAGAIVRALGALGDPAATADIVAFPGEGLLLADFKVDAETRAGQNPEAPRRALAKIVEQALEKLGDPAGAAFAEKLRAKTR